MHRWAFATALILMLSLDAVAGGPSTLLPPGPPRRPSNCQLGLQTHRIDQDVKPLRAAIEKRYADEWTCNDKTNFGDLRPDSRWGSENVCSNYIKGKGKLGSWGQFAFEHMTPKRYPHLFHVPRDVAQICPNSKSWNSAQIKKFYVWVLAETSYAESGCRASPRLHRGPYGTLQGQFQMHKGHENDYSTLCENGDAGSALGSIRCMIGMLDDDVADGNSLFQRRGVAHFATLQRNHSSGLHNCQALKRFPGCGNGATCEAAFGFKRRRHR